MPIASCPVIEGHWEDSGSGFFILPSPPQGVFIHSRMPQTLSPPGWTVPTLSASVCTSDTPSPQLTLRPFAEPAPACPRAAQEAVRLLCHKGSSLAPGHLGGHQDSQVLILVPACFQPLYMWQKQNNRKTPHKLAFLFLCLMFSVQISGVIVPAYRSSLPSKTRASVIPSSQRDFETLSMQIGSVVFLWAPTCLMICLLDFGKATNNEGGSRKRPTPLPPAGGGEQWEAACCGSLASTAEGKWNTDIGRKHFVTD